MTRTSIHQAAYLILYKVPVSRKGFIQFVRDFIDEIRQTTTVIIDGKEETLLELDVIMARPNSRQPIVRVFIPDEVHALNKNSWLHIVFLKEQLDLRQIENIWAPCAQNDRACSVAFSIDSEHPQPLLHFHKTRLEVLNKAARTACIQPTTHEWHVDVNDSKVSDRLTTRAEGKVQFASPFDVEKLRSQPAYSVTLADNSAVKLGFNRVERHMQPSSCKTIALFNSSYYPRGSEADYESPTVKPLLNKIVALYRTQHPHMTATVGNFRISTDHWFLLCDPSDIVLANAICDYPMPDGSFFRPVYNLNGDPADYKQGNIGRYHRFKQEEYDDRCEDLGLAEDELPPPRTEFEPYVRFDKPEKRPWEVCTATCALRDPLLIEQAVLEEQLRMFAGVPPPRIGKHPERDLWLRKLDIVIQKIQNRDQEGQLPLAESGDEEEQDRKKRRTVLETSDQNIPI
ncbi:uncharacterized protein I303_104621 [Kwoniella dejecticola CBS 10117]|uniref:Uncharacterized protein n=1 Tax=Kwoniella dejecticola CBS 10117 TaxID=1296121 RepID=A0A1A6A4T6_9TREE|nr:uncharacterized protein I303_04401 [Kwoniella dejecticola CBS 10117]OBR85070.1 hypothetical protein I303_04401 [Kwoniella dejecticola CBS 10117]